MSVLDRVFVILYDFANKHIIANKCGNSIVLLVDFTRENVYYIDSLKINVDINNHGIGDIIR